jgi:hypothetical protein
VLALLWAFLLNAASSVALDISGLAARHALDFTLDVSLVRAFATFYVVYGTFRVSAESYAFIRVASSKPLHNMFAILMCDVLLL